MKSNCCDECAKSSFFPYRKAYSNLTGDELRAQCAQENGLNINDPTHQSLINACVKAKDPKAVNANGQVIVGYIQQGVGILQQGVNIWQQIFGGEQQPQPVDYSGPQYNNPPKGLSTGAIIGIIAGVLLLGGVAYYAFKPKK